MEKKENVSDNKKNKILDYIEKLKNKKYVI